MRIAIIGSNDGPERLRASLEGSAHEVVFIGLQKIDVPDEARALQLLGDLDFDLLVNCFANFRYRELHHRYRAMNVHLAPLPAYRGRHPLQWALINGEKTYGVTIHDINDNFDDGAIRWRAMVDVEDGCSVAQLREALMQKLESGFAAFLNEYDSTTAGLPNGPDGATYVTRRYPQDSLIADWTDREQVYRKVSALRDDHHPAYVLYKEVTYSFTAAARGERLFSGSTPATVVGRRVGAIEVVCGDGLTVWLSGETLHDLTINTKLNAL